MNRPLRIGFDLDGVLLYNPARIIRLPIFLLKRMFLKKRQLKFYIPKKPLEKLLWRVFHRSSLFIAPGLDEIKNLVAEGKIEAHLITARYSFLEDNLNWWLNKMKIDQVFSSIHHNKKDEQPHFFKERLIKKLDLDIFVEDNYDIVKHLTAKTKAKIFWIYNILDRMIEHPHKFPTLKKTVEQIKNQA